MRQLSIAAFLAIIALFGAYYLVTQSLHLSFYYPPTSVQFPEYRGPVPLPSITPGPNYRNEFNSGPSHSPSPKVQEPGFAVQHPAPVHRVTPVPLAAPTMNAITPMPAPTYADVTPPPFVHTPPAISIPGYDTVLRPSPSPSARFGRDDRVREEHTPEPYKTEAPRPSPFAQPESSASPSPKP